MAVKRSRTLCTAFLREVRVFYITPPKAALEIRIKQGFFNPKMYKLRHCYIEERCSQKSCKKYSQCTCECVE